MKTLPTINIYYWYLLISVTIIGETAADLLSMTFDVGYGMSTLILLGLFLLVLGKALLSKGQQPFVYWLLISLASTSGTTISDFFSRTLQFGYGITCVLVAMLLISVFILLKKRKETQIINATLDSKTELFYWLALLFSSIFGTAFGDLIANGTPLGFAGTTVLLLSLLSIIGFVSQFTSVSKEICYWAAIVIIHPIGATTGDFMTKPEGLNLGNAMATAIILGMLSAIIFIFRKAQKNNSL
ncbi:MAG TPA: hypothetical protein VK528_02095 [Flavobacterium sp.]|nr:hypothetical protein [Flavobacterium sp.]